MEDISEDAIDEMDYQYTISMLNLNLRFQLLKGFNFLKQFKVVGLND